MPHDKVGRKTYLYALVVIDIASRYKDAEALTAKDSSGIAKGFEKIYSRKLKWPHTLIVDPGTEFMGDVTKIMKKHNITIQRSEAIHISAAKYMEEICHDEETLSCPTVLSVMNTMIYRQIT